MDKAMNRKRYISLFSAAIIEAMAGLTYAWSVFAALLVERYNWSVSQVSLNYTIGFVVGLVITFFFGASFRRWFSVKKLVFIGGIIYAGSLILDATNPGSIWLLYLYHGLIISIGNTMVYPTLMSYSTELFPEKTGFASGVTAAGYGLGAVFWAPLAIKINDITGDVSKVFLVLGIGFMICMCGLSLLLVDPKEIKVDMSGAAQSGKAVKQIATPYNIGKNKMMRTPEFFMMMICFMCIFGAGNIVISQGSSIMQNMFGMTASAAAAIVSVISITNTIGRIIWGNVSDRIGKSLTVLILQALLIVVGFMLFIVKQQTVFTVFLVAVTFLYGGAACLLGPTTGEIFGKEHTAENYSVTFCAFGLSSFIGPTVMASLIESTGKYTPGFIYSAFLGVVGLVMMIIIKISLAAKLNKAKNSEA